LYGAFALFDEQNHLAPPYSPHDIVMGKFWYIVGIYEVRLNRRIDIEEDDQYGVEALEICQERWSGSDQEVTGLGAYGYEEHEPVLDLKPPD
jgi:hypothetical protein